MGGRGEAGKFGEPLGDSGRRLNSFPKNFFGPGVFLGVESRNRPAEQIGGGNFRGLPCSTLTVEFDVLVISDV